MIKPEAQDKEKREKLRNTEPAIKICENVDIFEQAVRDHQRTFTETDNPVVNEEFRDTFTKINFKTISNFATTQASFHNMMKLQYPEQNVTVQGRYTNSITNIAFTQELAFDFKSKLRDLQQTYKKVKRNADANEPYISLKVRIDKFRQETHSEYFKQNKALMLVNNDVLRFKSENEHLASVLLDCEKRIGKLEKHVGVETPSKLETLSSNP